MLKQTSLVSLLAATVSAHQNFHQFWVNGVSPGYQVAIRMPPSNNPVVLAPFPLSIHPNQNLKLIPPQTNVLSNDITCNVNGNLIPRSESVYPAKAGDTIKVQWDSSTHPGPITHFLHGPVTDVTEETGIGEWTKIDELDYVNGSWANQIMEAVNMTYTFKLPSKLTTGDYLVRIPSPSFPNIYRIPNGKSSAPKWKPSTPRPPSI